MQVCIVLQRIFSSDRILWVEIEKYQQKANGIDHSMNDDGQPKVAFAYDVKAGHHNPEDESFYNTIDTLITMSQPEKDGAYSASAAPTKIGSSEQVGKPTEKITPIRHFFSKRCERPGYNEPERQLSDIAPQRFETAYRQGK